MDHRITSYLPRLLLRWYEAHPHAGVHRCTDHTGVLLFADTSGFTALTCELAKQGKIGFEILTELLNSLFKSLEEVIVLHDGDILKFSGDAVWCYFPPQTPIEQVFAEMLYEVDRLNREHPVCRTHKLSLHAGATAGQFEIITFGNADSRLEFEIAGSIIPDAYHAADVATAGEIALASSLQNMDTVDHSNFIKEGYRVVKPSPVTPASNVAGIRTKLSLSDWACSTVEKYVPEAVRERKLNDGLDTGLQSEHRQVTVLFANLLLNVDGAGETDSTSFSEASEAISNIFRIIRGNRGTIARIDPFVRGHKLLALFGALKRSESDRLNALQAAEAILRLPSSKVSVKIGLSAGPLLCGEVGSQLRHEYTVMGEAVNLAARLMSKADSQTVLFDQALFDHIRELATVTRIELNLKGVGDKVSVYQFNSWRQLESELPTVTELVGREEPLKLLDGLWQSRPTEQTQWVLVSGEPGIGKTSLVSAYAQRQLSAQTVYLSGYGARLHHPGWLLAQWLKRIRAITEGVASSEEEVADQFRKRIDAKWWPLFNQILGLTTPDNEWTRGLSTELRLAKLTDIVARLLEELSTEQLVILDDLDAVDSLSSIILSRLLTETIKKRLMVILVGNTFPEANAESNCQSITLAGLTNENLTAWLGGRFVASAREKELCELLISRSEGNPLFINETLAQLSAQGVIGHLTDETNWEVLKPLDEIKLADRLEDLQLARFDALPESHRQILKMAAVLDGRFSESDLIYIARLKEQQSVRTILTELVSADMLVFDSAHQSYNFVRDMTRQAIYNCVPQSDLGRLHSAVGKMLLAEGKTDDILRLAYHFSRGDDSDRAFEYSFRAGRLAQDKGLLVETAASLRRCVQLLASEGGNRLNKESKLEFLQWATEFSIREGNYDDAQRFVHDWRKLSIELQRPASYHAAANEFARVLWKRSKYNRCRQVLNRLARKESDTTSRSLMADSYSLLAELSRRTGRLPEAQSAGKRAVELAKSGQDRRVESEACNNLGLAYWSAGMLMEAHDCFVESLKLQEGNGSKHTEARVANNLAIIAEEMGDYLEARRLAGKAKNLFMELGDRRNQAYASGNLANLLVGGGHYREAIELYNSADRIFLKLGETHPHNYTVGNLGDLNLLLGEFDEAHSRYTEVAKFARENGDEELEAEMCVRFAEHTYYGGQQDEARNLYETAIQKAKAVGSLEFRVRGTIGLCRYLIGERNAPEAGQAIDQLVEFAQESKSDRTRYEAEFLTGEMLRITGQSASSLPHYRECAAYASRQGQFELALKCFVRLCETEPDSRDEAADNLKTLLDHFLAANGEQIFERLMNSRYFQFFHETMKQVVGAAPRTVEKPC
jgi:class 3 adenylate cyclase/tetratricopeptide (TPR) repeat protein